MTLIYEQPASDEQQPQTHMLIIGVGAYRHLRNGLSSNYSLDNWDLGQLTSPPRSARALADWAVHLKGFCNPQASLGSVELLLSESGENAPTYRLLDDSEKTIDLATIEKIKQAFYQWFTRCNTNPQNLALFYFCGHGVMIQGNHILLAEDYGANSWLPFEGAIDFEKMYNGMGGCQTIYQYYFIDACSNFQEERHRLLTCGAQFFIAPTKPGNGLVIMPTSPGESAYGLPDGISLFTDALIQCMDGQGSEPEDGQWVINSDNVIRMMNRILRNIEAKGHHTHNELYHLGAAKSRLLSLRQNENPPKVTITIRLDPRLAIEKAYLCLDAKSKTYHFTREPRSLDWEIENAPAGPYFLQVLFKQSKYQHAKYEDVKDEMVWVLPPGPSTLPDRITVKPYVV